MSKTIWKYPLTAGSTQEVQVPQGSETLCIQAQSGKPYLWVLVDPLAPLTSRTFEIYGTGHPIQENLDRKYIGTVQLASGALVFHCFEIIV